MIERLAILVGVGLVMEGLRASYAVTMPIVVACVVIASVWPIHQWLQARLPARLGYSITVMVLLILLTGTLAATYFATLQVVRAFAQDWSRLDHAVMAAVDWVEGWGLALGAKQGMARLVMLVQDLLTQAYVLFAYLGFIAVLVLLGLLEARSLKRKLLSLCPAQDRGAMLDAVDQIAAKVRSYLGVTTLTSVITGLLCAGWAFVTGLDFALLWGVMNFLLNYIPVIGNIIGIIPPSIYAVVQFQDWTQPSIILAGLTTIQFGVSCFVYPVLQGQHLALSPIAVVIAIAFWSWIWGIAGALIAVPLTGALVIACERFPSTRWIAVLLARSDS
ncbi:MAG: AI-2E family transporter [Methylobacterium sp.]|uniref:AI-2E family transporter n=1 Tax=Methylobacterium sp. TaxID=409 RepID=UPI00258F5F03|nr:AI-2E family transporter [Methylobacterium sp.]MBY0299755.1 AI-2E family transporter [Methylobacterium sp.]